MCKGNDIQRKVEGSRSDRTDEPGETGSVEEAEERGQGCMIVNVQRHSYNSNSKTFEMYELPFTSYVYDIRGNEFLVYDPGSDFVSPHFEWYDFTEKHTIGEEYEYFVTLERD